MKIQQLAIICIALTLLVAASLAKKDKGGKGKKDGKGRKKNMTCKGEPIQLDELRSAKEQCKAELISSTGESTVVQTKGIQGKKSHKNPCVKVCVGKKAGILNEDGTINESGMETYVKSHFPENTQTELSTAFKACYENSFKSAPPSMDNDCQSYMEAMKCGKKALFNVCEIQMGKRGKKNKNDNKNDNDDGNVESGE